jgi:hypothetical protein
MKKKFSKLKKIKELTKKEFTAQTFYIVKCKIVLICVPLLRDQIWGECVCLSNFTKM